MAKKKNTVRKSGTSTQSMRTSKKVDKKKSGLFGISESYISLLLGLVIVVVAALLVVTLVKNRNAASLEKTQAISAISTVSEKLENVMNQKPEEVSNTAVAGKVYIVKQGDDLWSISVAAYKDGYKWAEIMKANNLSRPEDIKVGQQLSLPQLTAVNPTTTTLSPTLVPSLTPTLTSAPTPTVTPTVTPKATSSPTKAITPTVTPGNNAHMHTAPATTIEQIKGNSYKVVSGDTLWDIAERAYGDGTKWVEIAHANNLVNPDLIHSGNVFKLPR